MSELVESEAIVVTENKGLTTVTDGQINRYLESMGNTLTEENKGKFVELAKAFNLNPFKREIYGIQYGNTFNVIVGYEVYLKRAEMSGQLSGWKAGVKGVGNALIAWVEIRRKDWSDPFYHEVYLEEYKQPNTMWKNKPKTMLKKVAMAQGFRLAFPVELGGIPYTSDELPDREIKDVTPKKEAISQVDQIEKAKAPAHPVVNKLRLRIAASGIEDVAAFAKFAHFTSDDLDRCQAVLNDFDLILENYKAGEVK